MTPQIQHDLAEGSHEAIEMELARRGGAARQAPQGATWEAAKRILGYRDDAKIAEILSLHPTIAEIEQALVWSKGEGDLLGKSGHD